MLGLKYIIGRHSWWNLCCQHVKWEVVVVSRQFLNAILIGESRGDVMPRPEMEREKKRFWIYCRCFYFLVRVCLPVSVYQTGSGASIKRVKVWSWHHCSIWLCLFFVFNNIVLSDPCTNFHYSVWHCALCLQTQPLFQMNPKWLFRWHHLWNWHLAYPYSGRYLPWCNNFRRPGCTLFYLAAYSSCSSVCSIQAKRLVRLL